MGPEYADDHGHAQKTKQPASPDRDHTAAPTTAAATPANANVPDTVLTKWMVNYSSVLGKRKDPSRTDADQLIVDELRVQPNNGDPAVLHGGNAARSGRVHLGDATVAKGPGSVAALIRYGQRASFKAHVSLDSKPSRKEQQLLNKLEGVVTRRALEEASTEGDYAAISAKLEAEFGSQFEGKNLRVSIMPDKAKQAGIVAREGSYEANGPSKFEVDIEPDSIKEHTRTASHGESGEEGEAQSHSEGSKIISDTTTQTKATRAKEYQETFISTLTERVTTGFKEMQQEIVAQSDEHTHKHEKQIGWKAGIGPAKGDDKAKPAAGGGDGLLRKAWNALSGGTKWFLRTVKDKVIKRIPLVNAAVELFGGLWDAISGRISIERNSVETESDTNVHEKTKTNTQGTEISDLSEIARTRTTQVVSSNKEELETFVSAKFGAEVAVGDKRDTTNKKTVNNTYTETSTVYEARIPRITIKKLG